MGSLWTVSTFLFVSEGAWATFLLPRRYHVISKISPLPPPVVFTSDWLGDIWAHWFVALAELSLQYRDLMT